MGALPGDSTAVPSDPALRRPALTGLVTATVAALIAALLAACGARVSPPPAPAAPAAPSAPAPAKPVAAPDAAALPETGVVRGAGSRVTAQRHAIATGHPLASAAGLQMLREGGSALDAAIAAQMVLTLVEPQSSGIGGGALLMAWDGRELQAWDGRETAPAQADERLLLDDQGQPMSFLRAAVGGRAVGVPGTVRMLEAAHQRQGRLPWARLFGPAISLAEDGFPVSERLHRQLDADRSLRLDPQARAYFYDADGQPHPVGHRLRNPALARILMQLAQRGSVALHEGPVAADLVARVRQHPGNPGRMTMADLAGYEPRLRTSLCTRWRERWQICGFPPPSSGHLAIMQMLGILDRLPQTQEPLVDGLPGPGWLHAYTEAARLAYADRAQYVADPEFVAPPAGRWTSLLDGPYLQERAALVGAMSMKRAEAGHPRGEARSLAPQTAGAEYGTSHVSVVDGQGRAVSLTTTIEAVFGARLMADGGTGLTGGYLLNNELTDFSASPTDARGWPIANRVQGGKRPRSSMSPTLVFDARDGQLLMSLGSPLGQAIPHLVARTLVASLVWELDPLAAISQPHVASFNGPTLLETGRYPARTIQALRERGHEVRESDLTSGLQLIRRTPRGWEAASDPRREGQALGD